MNFFNEICRVDYCPAATIRNVQIRQQKYSYTEICSQRDGDTSYQWEKYHPYTNSWKRPSHRAVNVTSPKLIFKMIAVDDEGIYRCIATDNGERVASENATITVFG